MASSLWKLGGLSVRELGTRVYKEIWKDGLLDSAAQLAYYFLFSLFPLLIFLTSIFGFIVGSDNKLQKNLFTYLGTVLPSSALDLVSSVIKEVSQASSGGKLTIGLLLALWAASSGLEALTQSINKIYEVKETRSWWWRRLLSVFLTVVLAILIISALTLVLFGGQINDYVTAKLGFGAVLSVIWQILQYLIVLTFVLLSISLIYYFSPDIKEQSWRFITPGAVVAVALWLLISFGFRLYLQYFNSYSATYGSLGAVIILMFWLYFTGAAILIGGEINCEIENAAAQSGEPDAKAKGEKSPRDGGREAATKQQSEPASDDTKVSDKEILDKQKSISVNSKLLEVKDSTNESVLADKDKHLPIRSTIFTKVFAAASILTGIVRSFRGK
ncbi:MAG: YihY/virulence factor BrkB family protein [Pyrinomonadaceae bacterium]